MLYITLGSKFKNKNVKIDCGNIFPTKKNDIQKREKNLSQKFRAIFPNFFVGSFSGDIFLTLNRIRKNKKQKNKKQKF